MSSRAARHGIAVMSPTAVVASDGPADGALGALVGAHPVGLVIAASMHGLIAEALAGTTAGASDTQVMDPHANCNMTGLFLPVTRRVGL